MREYVLRDSADRSGAPRARSPFLHRLARRAAGADVASIDDYFQIGVEIAWRRAAEYDPTRGTFLNFIDLPVRAALRDARIKDLRQRDYHRAALALVPSDGRVRHAAPRELAHDHTPKPRGHITHARLLAGVHHHLEHASARAGETTEEIVIRKQEHQRQIGCAYQLIGRLPDRDRELFLLVETEGVSVKDAAMAMGIGYERAKRRLREIREGLRREARRAA